MVISISNCFTRRYQVSPMKGHFLSQLGCWGHQTWLMEILLNLWACKQERVLHNENCPGSSVWVWLEGRYVQLAMVEATTIHWLYILMICPFWMVKKLQILVADRTQNPFRSFRTTPAWYHWPVRNACFFLGSQITKKMGLNETDDVPQQFLRWKNGELSNQKMVTLNHLNPHNLDLWWSLTYTLSQRQHGMSTRCASYTKWAPSRIGFISPIFESQMMSNVWVEKKTTALGWKSHCHFWECNISLYNCHSMSQLYLSFIWHFGGSSLWCIYV